MLTAMSPWFESFVFGAANSLHCAGMCGPLALAFDGTAFGASSYQLGRTLAYGAVGVGLGGLGSAVGADELRQPAAWVAFAMALGLVLLVLFGERHALAIPGLGKLLARATAASRSWPRGARALALGLCTPLLPCGLLWAACGAAGLAGSAAGGGVVMVGFALGSLPVLMLAQTQVGWLLRRFGPRPLFWLQRGAMLLAAGLLVWRGALALAGGSCCD